MDFEKELIHRTEYLGGGQLALIAAFKTLIRSLPLEQQQAFLNAMQSNLEDVRVHNLNSTMHDDYVNQFEHIYERLMKL